MSDNLKHYLFAWAQAIIVTVIAILIVSGIYRVLDFQLGVWGVAIWCLLLINFYEARRYYREKNR